MGGRAARSLEEADAGDQSGCVGMEGHTERGVRVVGGRGRSSADLVVEHACRGRRRAGSAPPVVKDHGTALPADAWPARYGRGVGVAGARLCSGLNVAEFAVVATVPVTTWLLLSSTLNEIVAGSMAPGEGRRQLASSPRRRWPRVRRRLGHRQRRGVDRVEDGVDVVVGLLVVAGRESRRPKTPLASVPTERGQPPDVCPGRRRSWCRRVVPVRRVVRRDVGLAARRPAPRWEVERLPAGSCLVGEVRRSPAPSPAGSRASPCGCPCCRRPCRTGCR